MSCSDCVDMPVSCNPEKQGLTYAAGEFARNFAQLPLTAAIFLSKRINDMGKKKGGKGKGKGC